MTVKWYASVVLLLLFAAPVCADMAPGPWGDDPVSDPLGNPNPVPPLPKPAPGMPDTPPTTADDGWRPLPVTTALLTVLALFVVGYRCSRRLVPVAVATCSLLLFVGSAFGAPPKVPGPRTVAVNEVFEVEFEEDAAGPAVLDNPYPLGAVFVREAKPSRPKTVAYIIQPKVAGTYRFTLWTDGDKVGKAIPVAYYEFVVGGSPVPPGPPTPPGPNPPTPPTPVPPAPLTSFRVFLIYESADNLTPAQRGVVFGKVVEDWLNANCSGGKTGWRRRDKDAPGENDPAMSALWSAIKPAVTVTPCIAVERNGKVEIINLEPTPAKMVEVMTRYKEGK